MVEGRILGLVGWGGFICSDELTPIRRLRLKATDVGVMLLPLLPGAGAASRHAALGADVKLASGPESSELRSVARPSSSGAAHGFRLNGPPPPGAWAPADCSVVTLSLKSIAQAESESCTLPPSPPASACTWSRPSNACASSASEDGPSGRPKPAGRLRDTFKLTTSADVAVMLLLLLPAAV